MRRWVWWIAWSRCRRAQETARSWVREAERRTGYPALPHRVADKTCLLWSCAEPLVWHPMLLHLSALSLTSVLLLLWGVVVSY